MEMEKEIIGVRDVMDYLGVSQKVATRILNTPGCPVLLRRKNEKFRIPRAAFIRWWEGGGYA